VGLRSVIFLLGVVAALSPLVWGRLFDEANVSFGDTLLLSWQLLPFGLLAASQGHTPLSRGASLIALALLVGVTVAVEVFALLFPGDDGQVGLLFVFVPIYLSIGVGLLIGLDSAVRAGWRRVKRDRAAAE
jgi:hypothetical protein